MTKALAAVTGYPESSFKEGIGPDGMIVWWLHECTAYAVGNLGHNYGPIWGFVHVGTHNGLRVWQSIPYMGK